MRFASEQFKDYFQKRFEGFSDNWCSPVAQATVERMKYRGIRLEGSVRADDAVSRRWERNEADRGLAEALKIGRASCRERGEGGGGGGEAERKETRKSGRETRAVE